jgi:hypothetical protein
MGACGRFRREQLDTAIIISLTYLRLACYLRAFNVNNYKNIDCHVAEGPSSTAKFLDPAPFRLH